MFHILLSCDSQGSMECVYVCMYVSYVNTPPLNYKYFKANISPRSIFIQHSDEICHFSPLGEVRRTRKRVTKKAKMDEKSM